MPDPATTPPLAPPGRALFAATIFLGAFLIFLVQPLIGKYVLPWFGGAPAVWNACLLFFQAALLAGYAWAYALVRWLPPRGQAGAHAALLVAAALTLPIIPGPAPAPEAAPTPALLWLLATAVGLPYIALAATGPLVQAWYARRWPAASPYPLYALSNIGSFLALIIYPAAIEPWLGRRAQAWTWSGLFAAAALASIAVAVLASRAPPSRAPSAAATPSPPPSRWDRVLWLALPAAASVLLSATTNLLCLDVGVVPFLWVVPLGLYLLSYVLAFAGSWAYPRWLVLGALVPALTAAVWMLLDPESLGLRVAAAPSALFLVCWACHGEVARRRPAPAHLTAFYLSLAAGGAVGGALVALVAPLVLPWFFEYHAGLVLGAALAAAAAIGGLARPWRWVVGAQAAVGILALIGGLVLAGYRVLAGVRSSERTFHGVLVVRDYPADGGSRELRHGSTVHGLQHLAPDRRQEPTSYYGPDSGVGLAMRFVRDPDRPSPRKVGVIGLGSGTLAAYARPGESWTFFEIAPEVERVARRDFTYLADCAGQVTVAIGDARLTLERAPTPYAFNLLVIDAFTSDAIPVHLLTAEAFALYRRHLTPGGMIAVHISNRHLDLRPVIKRQANQLGWAAVIINDDREDEDLLYSSDWVLITSDLGALSLEPIQRVSGHEFGAVERSELWTDDRTALWRILRW